MRHGIIESFFSSSQRLNDFSKTIRTKQTYIIGKIAIEDINPQLRRIEKQYNINLTETPLRNWFFNGKMFESTQWTQHLKPYIINAQIREQYSQPTFYKSVPASDKPKRTFWQKLFNLNLVPQSNNYSNNQTENNSNEDNQDEQENKEVDDLLLLDP